MKTIKVPEATGAALDWLVAKCEGYDEHEWDRDVSNMWMIRRSTQTEHFLIGYFEPSTDWSQGGPIIDREDIKVAPDMDACTTERGTEVYRKKGWMAQETATAYWIRKPVSTGPTPLIAAMRCYCSSKLGDIVEIPEELCPQQNS